MPELHLPSREEFTVQISPALAMALTLPLAELAPRFPGVDPWLAQLPSRLGRSARADLRLLCVPLSGALTYLIDAADDEESLQPALDALSTASPDELLERVLARLAAHAPGCNLQTLQQWIEHEPERVAQLITSMERPSSDDPFEIDTGRVLSLLRHPAELKSLAELRLRQLWHDHFGPRWREALPACRALAQEARRRFYLGDSQRVLEAVIGRKAQERFDAVRGKRLVFVPIPFLGPYVSTATGPDLPAAYIGFGLVRGGEVSGEAAQRDLLAALKALSEEARLNVIAYLREHGEGRAGDFMQQFGWSQPATSRHLRALESTGLIRSEWIDGVKRYTIDPGRARAIARLLEQFLTGE